MDPRYSAPHQRPPSSEDTMMAFGLILAVLAGASWFCWYKYHAEIAPWIIASQHRQMRIIALFTDRYQGLDAQALALNPGTVTSKTLLKLCHLVGLFFRWPAAVLIGSLALLCVVRSSPSRFTTSLDLDRLIEVQAEVFRTLAVIVGRRLRPVALAKDRLNPLDPALHVWEWIDRFARTKDGRFDETRAKEELARQLGPLWLGPEKAAPIARCLFAAFSLHAVRKREAAVSLLGDLAASMPAEPREGPEGPAAPATVPPALIARADAILTKTRMTGRSREVASKHGFTAPALMSVLFEARAKGGVLAAAQFRCLKLVDRSLWFALHSLGFPGDSPEIEPPMPNPRIEAMGARDHWAFECQAGRPLLIPAVDRAILAVRDSLSKARTVSSD